MRTKSLTEGNPLKLILLFAFPLMIGNFFQQVYTMVDAIVVSRCLGAEALAAIGATDWIMWLFNGLLIGVAQGFSVHLSACFGANDREKMQRSMAASISAMMIIWVVLMLFSMASARGILILLKTPEEILEISLRYLRILFLGFAPCCLFNLFSGMLRAVGNSQVPLWAMVSAACLNIALDILFVAGLHLPIESAALATILSQALSAAICFAAVRKIDALRLTRQSFVKNGAMLKEVVQLSLPLLFNNLIIGLGGLGSQAVINSYGTEFVAGVTATAKVAGLLEIVAASFGYAMMSYCGQNLGAGKINRIESGVKAMLGFELVFSCLIAGLLFVLKAPILALFLSEKESASALQYALSYMQIYAFSLPLLYLMNCLRSSVMGLQETLLPMISGIVQLFMRLLCAYGLTRFLDQSGIYYAEGAAWLGSGIMMAWVYLRQIRQLKKQPL